MTKKNKSVYLDSKLSGIDLLFSSIEKYLQNSNISLFKQIVFPLILLAHKEFGKVSGKTKNKFLVSRLVKKSSLLL